MLETIFIIWVAGFLVTLLGFFAVVGIQEGMGIPSSNASPVDLFFSCIIWPVIYLYWIFYYIGYAYRKATTPKRA